MKKILLGTTALIGAATLFAGAALAEDPKVTVGGFMNWEAGIGNDNFNQNVRDQGFRDDTEIHFNVAGKTEGGLGYGAEIDLQADITGSPTTTGSGSDAPGSSNSGLVARRTYAWLQGDNWGHFEMGSNEGAAATLKVDASNIARASGGIAGDWRFFANTNVQTGTGGSTAAGSFHGSEAFITGPYLPVEHGPATGYFNDSWGNDNKVTYYTPRFSGFQLGVSYTPSLVDRGQLVTRAQSLSAGGIQDADAGNIFSGGINYEGQFDQVGIALAATGETGKADGTGISNTSTYNDLGAWNVGGKLSYVGFSLAGSYGDWSDSLIAKSAGAKADYWTVGGAYETGPFGASVTYLSSKATANGGVNDKFQDVSVGADYKLAPGLTPFIEYTWYDLDPNVATLENKGGVFLIGSQLSF